MSGLEALIINGKKKAKRKAKRTAAQKRATKKLIAFNKKRKAKKAAPKRKSHKRKAQRKGPNSFALLDKGTGVMKKVAKGTAILARRPARSKKQKSARKNKLSSATMKHIQKGGSTNLPKGVNAVKQFSYKINKRRKKHSMLHSKKNGAFGMSIQQMIEAGAGIGIAVLVPKATGWVVKKLAMIPVVGSYIALAHLNPYGNIGMKAAVGLGAGYLLRKKTKFKTAGKAMMIATGVIAAQQIANKILGIKMLGFQFLDGIEYELSGIEYEQAPQPQEVGTIELAGIEEDSEYMGYNQEDEYIQ